MLGRLAFEFGGMMAETIVTLPNKPADRSYPLIALVSSTSRIRILAVESLDELAANLTESVKPPVS